MLYRRFGRTELQMPVFSCGGMRFMQSWEDLRREEIQAAGQENLRRTIHRAFELGINHFETARGYGSSEIQMGPVIAELPRDKIILQTKVQPRADPKEFEAEIVTSFSNLGLDRIDLLAIHGINTQEHLDWVESHCLEICEHWRQRGFFRFLGFSTHGQTELIRRSIATEAFDYVNLHWYYFNQRNHAAVEDAAARDMGIFIISPSDKGGRLYDPPDKLRRLCSPYSPIGFNNRFCLQNPHIHTLSVGAAQPADFDEHLASLAGLGDRDAVASVDLAIQQEMKACLGGEWLQHWDRHLPEIEATPGRVNLLDILRFHNLASALGMFSFGKMRYQLLGKKNHWFPGEQAGAFDEGAMIAALEQAGHADPRRVVAALREAHLWWKES
ncbi:MAG: hypothetical protein RL095_193 [Verrucomicrobiota bacterium]|jgi:predicted aldo/keto reductase-like oxidoreductase